jgi:hypothetical protein
MNTDESRPDFTSGFVWIWGPLSVDYDRRYLLWWIMSCSPVDRHQCFKWTYYFHFEGQRVRQERDKEALLARCRNFSTSLVMIYRTIHCHMFNMRMKCISIMFRHLFYTIKLTDISGKMLPSFQIHGRIYFIKWLVDLNSISGAVGTPIPFISETLVIVYQTTFLLKQKIKTFKF